MAQKRLAGESEGVQKRDGGREGEHALESCNRRTQLGSRGALRDASWLGGGPKGRGMTEGELRRGSAAAGELFHSFSNEQS